MSIYSNLLEMERPFRVLDRHLRRSQEARERQLVPQNFFNQWDFFKPLQELNSSMNHLNMCDSKVTADGEKFEVSVDVQHFAPDEVRVTVVDGQVMVEGRHEEKRDEHGYISRQFVRKYALPKNCLPDAVTSTLSSDGVLTVTAPRVLPLPSTGEKIIPITHTGPVKRHI